MKTNGSGRDYEREILSYINSPITNLVVALTVQLLSTHSDDEQLLDEPNTLLTASIYTIGARGGGGRRHGMHGLS